MKFSHATSTTTDGNMSLRYGDAAEVIENRQHFLVKQNLNPEKCIVMDSRHGDLVTIIDDSNDSSSLGVNSSVPADTLITQEKNLPLLLTTGDCQPISFFDPTTETIGLMHLSRHTFVLDLIEKTAKILKTKLKVQLENLEIYIGPHIHQKSYYFQASLKEESEKLTPYFKQIADQVHIDLTQAVIDTFVNLGVATNKIDVSEIDTFTSTDHFSHVREIKHREKPGRLATVTCLAD